MTLTQRLFQSCDTHADRVAMVNHDGTEFTFAQLSAAVRQWATVVRGVTERPRVGLLLPSCKEFGAVFFSILAAGKRPVPLNLLLSPEQLAFIANDAGLDTVVTSKFFHQLAPALAANVMYVEDMARADAAPATDLHEANESDTAVLLYTSGTVAEPRGVELTHGNIGSNIDAVVAAIHFEPSDVMLCVLPLFHSFALTTMLALPAALGMKVVYLPRFNAGRALQLIEEHRVTCLLGIASIFRVLAKSDEARKVDTSTLRLCVAGGEPLPLEVVQAIKATFGLDLLEGYGLTETSPVICVNRPERPKVGTAGQAIPGVEVMCVGADGRALPANREGEIWSRGPHIMKGYFNRPNETAEAIAADGWFRTGDMGIIDDEGYVKITGRIKELIISSGENISPVEIEEAILQHPAVFEAGVVPVPDATRGEAPKAFVALHEGAQCTEEELRAFCRKHLPAYKAPRHWEFRDELPHGPTGKLLRRALRE